MTYKTGTWGEQAKKRSKARLKTDYFRKYIKQWKNQSKKHYTFYKLKDCARHKVYNALKTGKLKRMPCVVCKKLKVYAHHPDYSKPLDIVWLCSYHHHELHHKSKIK